jgi:Na+/H+ antiporter NhaD/arsenite permease-like protein
MITLIPLIFLLGYLLIIFEHPLKLNKAASALLAGVLCWVFYMFGTSDTHLVNEKLLEHLGDISGILFFLLGAMTIVELIDAHDGFEVITNQISTKSKRKLLWIVSFITFFLSAVLDNLTTTIVMVSLLRKLLNDRNERMYFTGMVIIAANAGGVWSPIGDVTTTMLWIGGQITTSGVILHTFLAGLACAIIPLLFIGKKVKGHFEKPLVDESNPKNLSSREKSIVFYLGVGALIFVPVFKTITHLPPYMGMLFSLSIMWIVTEIIHSGKDDEDKNFLSVLYALRKIDTPSILFFLGILLAISALQTAGHLSGFAAGLSHWVTNENLLVILIGLISAVVDNVPLVAASMGMYTLAQFPTDSNFWLFLAYCTGTGGSALIIGSAAGVAAMGMEKIDFIWYLKKISLLAVLGYFAGALVFILQSMLL